MKKCFIAFQNDLLPFFNVTSRKCVFLAFLFNGCIFKSSVKILKCNLQSKRKLLPYTEGEIVVAPVPANLFYAKLKFYFVVTKYFILIHGKKKKIK